MANNKKDDNQEPIMPEIVIDGDELNDVKHIEIFTNYSKSKNSQKTKDTRGGKREKIPPEIMGAVIGAYLSGKFSTNADIAKELNLSDTFVSNVVNKIPKDYVPIRDENINARVSEKTLEFLESGLDALANISRITENQEWLMTQPADKLAIFYGVTADKVMKIMELIERANDNGDNGDNAEEVREIEKQINLIDE